MLQIKELSQPESLWCWATCARIITEFVNPDNEVVECKWAAFVFRAPDCCDNQNDIDCRDRFTLEERDFEHFGYAVDIADSWPSWHNAAKQLEQGPLAITEVSTGGTWAHMVVARGYVRDTDWVAIWDPSGVRKQGSLGNHQWIRYNQYRNEVGDFLPGQIYSNVSVSEPFSAGHRSELETKEDQALDAEFGTSDEAYRAGLEFVQKYGAIRPELFDFQANEASDVNDCQSKLEFLTPASPLRGDLGLFSYCVGSMERGEIYTTQLKSRKWATLTVRTKNSTDVDAIRKARDMLRRLGREEAALVYDQRSGKWFVRLKPQPNELGKRYILVDSLGALSPSAVFRGEDLQKALSRENGASL